MRLYISGMHCTACELNIGRTLKEIEGVKNVKINYRAGTADIDFDGTHFPTLKVRDKLRSLGYELSDAPAKRQRASTEQWLYAFLIVGGLYLVYKYLAWIGVLDLLNISTSEINFGAAFLIGVVASLSTCLMVVGAVVVSFASKYQTRGTWYHRNVQPHMLFHVGRLVTFFALGGVLGLLGSWFNFSGSFFGWFTILVALILVWLALGILGFAPSFGLRLPGKTTGIWHRLQDSTHALSPLLLGGFTFFLPCGFTQSMQLLALASGSFWAGAFSMLFFALGTAPILFTLGVTASRLQNKRSIVWQKALGLLVLLFGFYTLSSGLAIFGVNFSFGGSKNVGAVSQQGESQVIEMVVGSSAYSPNAFYLKKDVPVRWMIDGTKATGCTSSIIVPSLDIAQNLKRGENIIEFTPTESGKIAFSCGMGMVRGQFIVE